MGVEFTQATPEHRAALEKFLAILTGNRGLTPEMVVEPEGLEREPRTSKLHAIETEDPLLQLFYGEPLTAEEFHEALRKQRGAPVPATGEGMAAHA
jgi:hypothetical protein